MKLYELKGQFEAIDSMDLDTADDVQAYGDLYNSLDCALRDKIQASCMVIRNMESEVDAIKSEIDRLTNKRKIAENRIAWLKGYMQENLEAIGLDKVDTDLFIVRIQANPPSVDIMCELSDLADEYKRLKIEADKTAIKEALKNGIEVNGCALVQTKSIRIK